jgi:23S rRNA (cytosine1962-C5)-methyltransferase
MIKLNLKNLPRIELKRDVTKHLKRGHRWIFADCFTQNPKDSCLAELVYKNEVLGIGIVQPDTQLRFRLLVLKEDFFYPNKTSEKNLTLWFQDQWKKACDIRQSLPNNETNSFRLINGEGDGMPGLIIDIYSTVAVIKHDHLFMETFWDKQLLKDTLLSSFPYLTCIYFKRKNKETEKGIELFGTLPEETVFKENGIVFHSNIRDAAKTGFFLDQRDNRNLISKIAKNKTVLNLFSYTGGFSLFAAYGGAKEVTSVDISTPAINAVKKNFELNHFKTQHHDIAEDAFLYIAKAIDQKKTFDLVINDPPSFAPNEKSKNNAIEAYTKVFSDSLKLVKPNGYFAASSCSSHISPEEFNQILLESFSKSKKRGTLIYQGGQPFDHPYPLIMNELRYLKFNLYRLD